jgi:hypothetical protein
MSLTASEVKKMKYAQPSTDGVLPEILERWSPRAFADRDVSPADLKIIFEAGRWGAVLLQRAALAVFCGSPQLRDLQEDP